MTQQRGYTWIDWVICVIIGICLYRIIRGYYDCRMAHGQYVVGFFHMVCIR